MKREKIYMIKLVRNDTETIVKSSGMFSSKVSAEYHANKLNKLCNASKLFQVHEYDLTKKSLTEYLFGDII